MKYEKFVYTRDFSTDYSWHMKAESLPNTFYKYMQTFIYLRDELREYENLNWNKIVFFMKHKGMNVACRVLTAGVDYVGRVIYSIEGIVSRNIGARSIYAMPDIIKYFYFVEQSFEKEHQEGDMSEFVEILDAINPLLPMGQNTTIPEELDSEVFKQFVADVGKRKVDYACIVGPEATIVYSAMRKLEGEQIFSKVYDLDDTYMSSEMNQELLLPVVSMDDLKDKKENRDEPVRLYIKFYKEGRHNGSYEWILRRESDNLCIKSDRQKFVKGISFERLFTEANKIKTYYSLLGLQIR